MHCIDPECEKLKISLGAGRLLIQNRALPQYAIFPVVAVLCFRPIVRILCSLIVKLFKAIVWTCEIRVSDEIHNLLC